MKRHKQAQYNTGGAEINQPRLLTPREAAEYLRLNPRTVTRLAREGKIPAIKIGKRWRIKHEALAGVSAETSSGETPAPRSNGRSIPAALSISSLMHPELIILNLDADGKHEALEKMVACLVEGGHLREPGLFLSLLMEREELMSTSIADGVAIPHPRRAVPSMFERSMLVLAVSPSGVEFDPGAGLPVRLFFLICAADDRAHLRILARLSQLLRDTQIFERILSARFPQEVIEVVAGLESSLTEDRGLIAG
ncbi:MAG: PTS sugar transporter subunit IIA [Planctomycetota bacterium]